MTDAAGRQERVLPDRPVFEDGFDPCPVCEGQSFIPHVAITDNRTGVFGEQRFTMFRCDGCGLIALRPMIVDPIGAHEMGYRYRPGGAGARTSPIRDLVRRIWHVIDGSLTLDRFSLHGRVLDLGPGSGANLAYLTEHGIDAIGVEPNPHGVQACRERGLSVIEGTIESPELDPASFDAIVATQVVEHLPDPVGVLVRAEELLRPGGRLLIMTPNADSFFLRVFGVEWAHWHVPYHLHLYGPQQLRRLLSRTTLEVESIRTSTPSFWVKMSFQLWRRRSQQTGWVLMPAGWQPHPLARLGLAPLLRAVDRLGRGDCLVAIARKAPSSRGLDYR